VALVDEGDLLELAKDHSRIDHEFTLEQRGAQPRFVADFLTND
jgi:hypothetical protein